MTRPEEPTAALRSALSETLRASRAAEREVFAALGPVERDATAPDGGWSPRDHLAHLSAWRRRQTERMIALREGRPNPFPSDGDFDAINAAIHAERAGWTWPAVDADADATTDALIAEVAAAADPTLADPQVVATVMGNGAEHDLGHLPAIAARVGLEDRVLALADATRTMVDRDGWPPRAAAFARYNLACYHALGGRLDTARELLRLALPAEEDLRTLAPTDDDLVALRAELPSLGGG